MSGKKFDVCYAIPPAKEGDKPRWIRCGVYLDTKNGPHIKLDCIPVAFNGWLALFEPRQKDNQAPKNDDIDF